MFGRNHFVKLGHSPYESLSPRVVNRYLVENVVNENGDIDVIDKVIQVDLSVPQTPQSGVECHIGDLSYAIRTNSELPNNAVQLRLTGGGNPLADFRVFQSILRDAEDKFNDSKDDK